MSPYRGDLHHELIEIASALEDADLTFARGNYADAVNVYRRALDLLEHAFGKEDPDTILALQKLGDALYLSSDYAGALPIYRRLLAAGEKILGENHHDVRAMAAKINETASIAESRNGARAKRDSAARLTYSSIAALRTEATGTSRRINPERLTDNFAINDADQGSFDHSESDSPSGWADPTLARGRSGFKTGSFGSPSNGDSKKTRAGNRSKKNEQSQIDILALLRENAAAVGFIVLILVGLMAGGFLLVGVLNQPAKKNAAAPQQTVVNKQRPTRYATGDDGKVIDIKSAKEASLLYSGFDKPLELPVIWIGPDWKDFIAPGFEFITKKDLYMEWRPEGLTDERGINYYAEDSAEVSTMKQVMNVAVKAQQYYKGTSGTYPQDDAWTQTLSYKNPLTGMPERPDLETITLVNDDGRMAIENANSDTNPHLFVSLQLLPTAMWKNEPDGRPCAVHALCVKHQTSPPIWEFYVHGFDRHGKLITNDLCDTVYLIGVKNGQSVIEHDSYALPTSPRLERLVVATLPPGCDLRVMHCLSPILTALLCLLILLVRITMRARQQYSASFTTVDVVAFVLILISGAWAAFLLLAP
ncbi:MAG TPA: tetratricopeptide repeat protein [Planktothrix sp.]|jgi:hypothetical protein